MATPQVTSRRATDTPPTPHTRRAGGLTIRAAVGLLLLGGLFGAARAAPAVPAGPGRDEARTLADVLADLNAVEAKVTDVTARPDLTDAGGKAADVTLVVTVVYCGRAAVRGDEFHALCVDGVPYALHGTRLLHYPEPIPKVGDAGLWQVTAEPGGKGSRVLRGNRDERDRAPGLPLLGHNGPLRAGEAEAGRQLVRGLGWVEVAADDAERLRRLAVLARTGGPYLADVVRQVLDAAAGTPGRAAAARDLFLDPKVPIPTRTALDAMLCRWPDPGWAGDPGRQAALLRMAADARERAEFEAVGHRIRDAAEDHALSIRQCLAVARAALANDRLLATCPDLCPLTDFAIAPGTADDRDAVFGYFRDLLRSTASDPVRRAAAGAIADVGRRDFPLTDEQVATVRRLRDGARDKETVRLLDLALDVAAAKRRPQTRPATPPPPRLFGDGSGLSRPS